MAPSLGVASQYATDSSPANRRQRRHSQRGPAGMKGGCDSLYGNELIPLNQSRRTRIGRLLDLEMGCFRGGFGTHQFRRLRTFHRRAYVCLWFRLCKNYFRSGVCTFQRNRQNRESNKINCLSISQFRRTHRLSASRPILGVLQQPLARNGHSNPMRGSCTVPPQPGRMPRCVPPSPSPPRVSGLAPPRAGPSLSVA